ncbi:MAG: rhodanese-like domain-containing protein [Planctomycetota bacterium]
MNILISRIRKNDLCTGLRFGLRLAVLGVGMAAFVGCNAGLSDADLTYLGPVELHNKLTITADPDEPVALVDLRDERAFEARRLPGALRAAVQSIGGAPRAPWIGRPIVVYAEPDGLLAAAGAKKLMRSGYQEVYVLRGGVQAWAQAGLPLDSGPVDPRQIPEAFGQSQPATQPGR